MSIVANIISAVLKAVVSNKVGNGLMKELVDISIGEVSEKGIEKINNFICEEKSKIDYILSKNNMLSMGIPEENIEYIVAEIKDLFSKIEITDEIIRQRKYDSENLNTFLWDEYCKTKSGHIECGNDINKALFSIAEALIKLMYTSKNFEKDILSRIDISIDSVSMEVQKISKYLENNICKLDANNQLIIDILLIILKEIQNSNMQNKDMGKKIKSRTQEYADKWNDNMFLNNFDKRDENAGVNVKLKEVYLEEHLPHYIWGNNNIVSDDLKELLSEYINEKRDNKMLMIFGQPGIGKSTLITWITANFNDRINDILVYKFASDLGNVDWNDGRISNRILKNLCLNYDDLNGKMLILDGFDEVSIEADRRRNILDNLYGNWIRNNIIENFSLVITCRENYVSPFAILKCKYITLQPWDERQIRSFCTIFQEKTKNSVSVNTIDKLIENKEILGIPLILYMVLALDISIEKEGSIVDVYDKIFSLEGGIYDRCIEYKSFADKHWISEIKKQIHQISREIAIWMFENEPDEAYIPQEEYQKICRNTMQDENKSNKMEQDFLIGNFFKLVKHCEGIETEELYFVHRTVYEYFVAETIYNSIESAIRELSVESQEELAKNIAIYLKQGEITYTVGEYLLCKIRGLFNELSVEKKNRFYGWWEETVAKMMKKGMFYYTNKNINYYNNIISKECQCFKNIFKILRLFLTMCNVKYVMGSIDRKLLEKYIKYCLIEIQFIPVNNTSTDLIRLDFNHMDLHEMNLTEMDLKKMYLNHTNLNGANLMGVNLDGKSLSDADLSGADLRDADLRDADLSDADLRDADLSGANLKGANLKGANLKYAILNGVNLDGTILDENNIKHLNKKYNLRLVKIYDNVTRKNISYEEYYKKRFREINNNSSW